MDQAQMDRLATCIRMLERQGIIDYNGHCSIRTGEGSMLINSGGCRRPVATADDILTIDLDGDVLVGDGKPPLEFHLHAGIYRARTNVAAIVHAHPRWSTYLTMTGTAYCPVFAQGTLLHPVPVLDSPDSVNTPALAARLAGVLGDRPAALMKSHGAVATGATIEEAFVRMTYLEENAERQVRAMQIGKPYVFSDEEVATFQRRLNTPALFSKAWNHFESKLGL